MTSLNPKQPLYEPTPEQRRRASRMVWLIVLGIPSLVGVMVAYLTFRGREVRDYGREVLTAVQSRIFDPSASYNSDCSEFLNKAVPAGVLECKVQVVNAQPEVIIKVEGDRQYRVTGQAASGAVATQADAKAYGERVANTFPAWVKANKPPALEVKSVPCEQVSAPVPAGVASCIVQSGPSDSPEVALKLSDGQMVTVPIP